MRLEEQSILLFKGTVQYGVTNRFVEDMEQAYGDAGVPVTTIQLTDDLETTKDRLTKALENKPLFALGVNGIGQFTIEGGSLYDVGGFPHVSWLVDHPVYHMKRMETLPRKFGVLGLVDQEHESFVEASVPHAVATLFLPHAGCVAMTAEEKERDLDLIFCGTGASPNSLRSAWANFPENEVACLEAGIEIGAAHPRLPLMEVATQVFRELRQEPNRALFLNVMLHVERFLRTQDRYMALKALDEQKAPVDVFGAGWDFADFSHHRIHDSVDFESALSLFKRARMALNVSWFFTSGAHERIFSAMLNGCISLTHSSKYLDSLPRFAESACIYRDATSLVDSVRSTLADKKRVKELGDAGKRFSEAGHTFRHRATELRSKIIGALSKLRFRLGRPSSEAPRLWTEFGSAPPRHPRPPTRLTPKAV